MGDGAMKIQREGDHQRPDESGRPSSGSGGVRGDASGSAERALSRNTGEREVGAHSREAAARPLARSEAESWKEEATSAAQLGRYELQAIIGRGGMGTVYKGYDPQLDRLVAIKAINFTDSSLRARFRREARIVGQLNHPSIVTVYDVGEVGDLAYIVMELIEGQTLADLLPSRLPWPEAVKLLVPVCRALDYAHNHGVIHRDVKPANILLAPDGCVKLTDFSIARFEAALGLTKPGAVLGTPLYMAPEQRDGETADRQADIFALGVILFELITGEHPSLGEQRSQGWGLLNQPIPPNFTLLEGLAPVPLQAIIRQAMADDPVDRFATAGDMARALTFFLAGSSEQAAHMPMVANAQAPSLFIEVRGSITITTDERNLLATAFGDYDRLYIEAELPDAAEGARLLVVLPVRAGRSLTRVIVRLAQPERLSREWRAYQEYVAGSLPPVTAHVQGAPLLGPNRKQALLRYTFAADVGEQEAENLTAYYRSHTGAEVVGLLEQHIFRAVAPRWWLNRRASTFVLREEYDHLLPVHLVVEQSGEGDVSTLVLKAGTVEAHQVRHLELGQSVQLQGFRVALVNKVGGEMTVRASLVFDSKAEQVRIRLTGLSPGELNYRPGDLVPNFVGRVIATRHHLLLRVARAAFPNTDPEQPIITLGTHQFPHPLAEYERLLDSRVSGMISVIHGDMRLESFLIGPESGLAWLINFAETREGHNLYDFLKLEAQVVTRLLPPLIGEGRDDLEDAVVAMGRALHTSKPPSRAPHPALQKPYDVLRAIRRQAAASMRDSARWDEYYSALVIMLLGALPPASEVPAAERLALLWAALACQQMDQPLRAAVPEKEPGRPSFHVGYVWLALGLVAAIIGLGVLTRGMFPIGRPGASSPSAQPGTAVAESIVSPSPTPTATPYPAETATLAPGSAVVAGRLVGPVNIHSGPGTDYPVVGTAGDGTIVQITGRNFGDDWWQIADPAAPGGYGWIEAQFVQIESTVVARMPIARASPPPTVTPTPTDTPTAPPTATPIPAPLRTSTPLPVATVPPPSPTPIALGTPTPGTGDLREAVYDTPGYRALSPQLARPPTNASFSPWGDQIAVTEGIKLYTVARDASYGHILMEEDENIRPIGGAVWSPNGRYLAFMADRKRDCGPCRVVGLVHIAGGGVYYLEATSGETTDLPRWTQDGRLLVTVHAGDPGRGTTYVYDTMGMGRIASGQYQLSSSHEGQGWFPWRPGKAWRVGDGGPSGYYGD